MSQVQWFNTDLQHKGVKGMKWKKRKKKGIFTKAGEAVDGTLASAGNKIKGLQKEMKGKAVYKEDAYNEWKKSDRTEAEARMMKKNADYMMSRKGKSADAMAERNEGKMLNKQATEQYAKAKNQVSKGADIMKREGTLINKGKQGIDKVMSMFNKKKKK